MTILMRIAPYLRISWAIIITINITTGLLEGPDYSADSNPVSQFLIATVGAIFAFYCTLTGIQEIMNRQLTHAKIFSLFGLIFEIIVFASTFWLIGTTISQSTGVLSFLILWQIGILVLIIVDLKKYLQPRSDQEEFS